MYVEREIKKKKVEEVRIENEGGKRSEAGREGGSERAKEIWMEG